MNEQTGEGATKEAGVNVETSDGGAHMAWMRARAMMANATPAEHDEIVTNLTTAIEGGIPTAGTDLGRYLVRVSNADPAMLTDALDALLRAAQSGGHSDKLAYVRAVHVLPPALTNSHHSSAAGILNTLLAEAPDTEIMVLTGYMLARGHGYAVNPERARDMMTAAAEAGSAEAQFELSVYDATGFAGPVDAESSLAHLRASAANGYARAMTNLGAVYGSGSGVEKDAETALEWYTKAAEAGSARAANTLAHMYGTGEGTTADAARSAHFARLAHTLAGLPPTF